MNSQHLTASVFPAHARRRMIRRAARAVLVSAMLFASSGCAVATIDVDVYKGPLSNEHTVQIEQMRVMAVSAAKLLQQYEIDLTATIEDLEKAHKGCPDAARDRGQRNIDTLKQVRSEVQSVSQLFDDQPGLALAGEARVALEKFRKSYSIFRPANLTEHEKLATPLLNAMKVGMPEDPALMALRDAYRGLLLPGRKNGRWVYFEDAVFKAYKLILGKQAAAATVTGANAQLEKLEDPEFVNADANLLGLSDSERASFIARTTEIARSFRESREALEQLFRTALKGIVLVGDRGNNTKYKQAERKLVEYALEFIQPKYLAGMLLYAKDAPVGYPPSAMKLRERLSAKWPKLFSRNDPVLWDVANGVWISSAEARAIVVGLLRAELQDHPEQTAQALLDLHDYAISNSFKPADLKAATGLTGEDFDPGPTRRYGLARGPSVELSELPEPREVQALVDALYQVDALNRGRPPEGLFTLIDLAITEGMNTTKDNALSRLRISLTQFAVKLTSLAEGQRLMARKVDPGFVENKDERRGKDQVEQYGRLIESIGTSIRVQVNELEAVRSHDKQAEGSWKREVRAQQGTLPRNVDAVLQKLKDDLTQEKANALAANKTRQTEAARLEAEAPRHAADAERLRTEAKLQDTNKAAAVQDAAGWREKQLGFAASASATRQAAAAAKAEQATLEIAVAQLNNELQQLKRDQAAASTAYEQAKQAYNESVTAAKPKEEQDRLKALADEAKKKIDDLDEKIRGKTDEAAKQQLTVDGKTALAKQKEHETELAEAEAVAAGAKAVAADENAVKIGVAADAARAGAAAADSQSTAAKAEAVQLRESIKSAEDRNAALDVTLSIYTPLYGRFTPAERSESLPAAEVMAQLRRRLIDEQNNFATIPAADRLTDTVDKLRTAAAMFDGYTTLGLTAADYGQTEANPTAVIDQEIAAMEAERREAIRQHGVSSPQAVRLADAIEAAYSRRASMIHIRPPAEYLKSSYPISSLQGGTATGWRNMLLFHAFKSSPGLGYLTNHDDDSELISQIDRQHWQNINRVRVASNGITNYVIAKDDIGNWYVKSFSGDPEPIIKAAKATALYAGSIEKGVDLIAQDRRRAAALAKGEDPPAPPDAAIAFTRKTGAFRDRYEQSLRDEAKSINDALGKVRQGIGNAWAADAEIKKIDADLPGRVLTPADGPLTAAKASAAKATQEGAKVDAVEAGTTDALAKLLAYQKAVLDNLATLPKPDSATLDTKKTELKTTEAAQAKADESVANAEALLRVRSGELAQASADSAAASRALSAAIGTPASPTHDAIVAAAQATANAASSRFAQAQAVKESAATSLATAKEEAVTAAKATTATRNAVAAAQSAYDKQVAARVTARKIVVAQAGTVVSDVASRLTAATDEYQTAVSVILQSSTAQDAAASTATSDKTSTASPTIPKTIAQSSGATKK